MNEPKKMLTPEELTERWEHHGVTLRTLERWRWPGKKRGPAYVKIRNKVMYPLEAVEQYERENTVIPTRGTAQ